MLRQVLLWASENRWMERQMRRRAFARRAVSRFMPGETAEAALEAARGLGEHGISTVFTKLGEALTDPDEIEEAGRHYIRLLERIAAGEFSSQISIKLTQLGQDLGQEVAQANLERLAEAAAESGNVVWVDMEASPYVDETLDIFTATLARHPNLGLCVQAYLYRTAADVERLLALGARLRLVKGAYQEPADVAWPRKPDVDENFMALTRLMLEGASPAAPHGIATHDIALLGRILEEARGDGPARGRVRGADALRDSGARAVGAEAPRDSRAGTHQLRSAVVPVVHAASGGTARQPGIRAPQCLHAIGTSPSKRSGRTCARRAFRPGNGTSNGWWRRATRSGRRSFAPSSRRGRGAFRTLFRDGRSPDPGRMAKGCRERWPGRQRHLPPPDGIPRGRNGGSPNRTRGLLPPPPAFPRPGPQPSPSWRRWCAPVRSPRWSSPSRRWPASKRTTARPTPSSSSWPTRRWRRPAARRTRWRAGSGADRSTGFRSR